jgi:hypothetical protein
MGYQIKYDPVEMPQDKDSIAAFKTSKYSKKDYILPSDTNYSRLKYYYLNYLVNH